uniref:hypothetical protein n=1 Tax=Pseudoclavibacter sp. RFBI5 TaxID=2080578 RepID=UPI0011B00E81|nr:hypothetical protein [Pseudoclavibacter sp. RFBI5]
MTDQQDRDRRQLDASGETLERLRSRARSVATIIAAVAAALAAGIVLSPTPLQPQIARFFGTAAVILFVVATAMFVSASLVNMRKEPLVKTEGGKRARAVLSSWEVRLLPGQLPDSPSSESFKLSAKLLSARIATNIRIATWAALAGLSCLVTCLVLLVWPHQVSVIVHVSDEVSPTGCAEIAEAGKVAGWVDRASLDGPVGSAYMTLKTDTCSDGVERTLYLDKSKVTLIEQVD